MKKRKSTHIITARDKGMGRALILFAVVLLLIFSFCSIFAVISVPTNPMTYSMAAFFLVLLAILIGIEANVFPDLAPKKMPQAMLTWFFTFIFVAFLAAFLISMNVAYLGLVLLFGLLVFIFGAPTLANEKQWNSIKSKTGGAVKRKIKNTKTGKKIDKKLKKRKKAKAKRPKRKIQGW